MITPFLCAIVLAQNPTPATTPPANPLGDKLKASKLTYTDIGAFLQVTFGTDGGKRKQTTYVRKQAETYLSLEANEVFSLVWESSKEPTPEFLIEVFQKRYKLGGLVYEVPSGTQTMYRIRYSINAYTSTTSDALRYLLDVAASTGDSLEKILSPTEDKL